MAIYDCFIFFNELDLLEWRLAELSSVVSAFVVVEATRTFSGKPKPLHFHRNRRRFEAFLPRIRHVVVEDLPAIPPGSARMYDTEGIQRDAIIEGLRDAGDGDLVMMSDADEIPRATAVGYAAKLIASKGPGEHVVRFQQRVCYYYLNLRFPGAEPWQGTRMATVATLRRIGGQALRVYPGGTALRDAGWHYSFFGGAAQAARKVGAWSHIEADRPPMNDPAHHARAMREGRDWDIDRNARLAWVPMNAESAPAYVLENLERFAAYVGPGEGDGR